MRSGDDSSTNVAVGCMTLLTLPLVAAWRAYVLAQLWTWFAVVQFGAKPVSLPMAYGLSLMVSMFASTSQDSKDDRTWQDTMIHAVVTMIVGPAIALGIGWIVKGML